MYENNDIFIGWSYVKALFDCLQIMSDKVKKDQIVTPRYIYRGITQRNFTSSSIIVKYLEEHPEEMEKLLNKKIENEKIKYKDKVKAYKKCYESKHTEMIRQICGQTYHDKSRALELLQEIVGLKSSDKNELFELIKPQFIRSGAAVRLFHQQNRTQYDYVAYLRNLISETKSRYPGEYKKYSDLELLAELQHKGAATCLVDFSNNFLVSLWFATQDYTNSDSQVGYVFCYDTNTDAIERNNLVFLNKEKEKWDIEQLIDSTSRTLDFYGNPICRFLLWKPSNINSRIARQDSIFVFGIEKFDISEHPVFILPIPPHWKEPIQRTLKDFFGITGETVYADAAGVATSNGKFNPLRTQTKYFNEDLLKHKDNYTIGFDAMDIFQKGTSALLKAQYSTALEYFSSFEGTNFFHIGKKIDGENHRDSERYKVVSMLIIELHYSKGICLRHLKNYREAKLSYWKSIDKCLKLLQTFKGDLPSYTTCNYLLYTPNLHRYVFDKLFKIVEDYIDFLFDIHDYRTVYSSLLEILRRYEENDDKTPYEMHLLVSSVCNEAKILHDIWYGFHQGSLDFVELPTMEASHLNPFCIVLDKLYRLINQIIENKNNDIWKDPNFDEDLQKAIKEAIPEQKKPRGGQINEDIFVGWFLDDINFAVSEKMKDKSDLCDEILRLTAIVEDCRRQIEGRKRHETY